MQPLYHLRGRGSHLRQGKGPGAGPGRRGAGRGAAAVSGRALGKQGVGGRGRGWLQFRPPGGFPALTRGGGEQDKNPNREAQARKPHCQPSCRQHLPRGAHSCPPPPYFFPRSRRKVFTLALERQHLTPSTPPPPPRLPAPHPPAHTYAPLAESSCQGRAPRQPVSPPGVRPLRLQPAAGASGRLPACLPAQLLSPLTLQGKLPGSRWQPPPRNPRT